MYAKGKDKHQGGGVVGSEPQLDQEMTMRKVKIEVTEMDIAKGRKRNCYQCPIAISVSRAFGSSVHTYVGWGEIGIPVVDGRVYVATPKCVRMFIEAFDRYGRVDPFSFELELP